MMTVIGLGKFLSVNWASLVAGVVAVCSGLAMTCSALVSIFLMIPGQQPEQAIDKVGNFFKSAAEFLGKFSRKKDDSQSLESVPPVAPQAG